MREAGLIAVFIVVIVKAAEIGVPVVLAWQTKTPGKKLTHWTKISGKPATLPFFVTCVRVKPRVWLLTEHQ